MMGIEVSKTCWAYHNCNKVHTVTSSWLFFSTHMQQCTENTHQVYFYMFVLHLTNWNNFKCLPIRVYLLNLIMLKGVGLTPNESWNIISLIQKLMLWKSWYFSSWGKWSQMLKRDSEIIYITHRNISRLLIPYSINLFSHEDSLLVLQHPW